MDDIRAEPFHKRSDRHSIQLAQRQNSDVRSIDELIENDGVGQIDREALIEMRIDVAFELSNHAHHESTMFVDYSLFATMRVPVSPRRPSAAWPKEVIRAWPPG